MLRSICIFILAGLCEIGGGYLVWLWLKEGKNLYMGLGGLILLGLYGVLATLQVEGFGRVYAAYGGIFIALSVGFAMFIDNFKPDKWDIIGALLAICGALIMMYAPRNL
ncbi:YnfA family protein [Helicobacter jaachi]|nr:YnfA family protein [Helicobacter jaachi]